MTTVASARQACPYHHASDLPNDAWRMMLQVEAAANIVLPFAKKALNFPRNANHEQLWIVGYDGVGKVEFVLSCTKRPLGKDYPIFIVSAKSSAQIAQEEKRGKDIADALLPLVLCLLEQVSPQRIFSVFAIAKVTETFARILEAHVPPEYGIQAHPDPYYDATFTFCTSETLKSLPASSLRGCEDVVIALRRADMSHLKGLQVMLKAFSETSPPFVLDDDGAELEARMLINNQQVWVHMVQIADQAPQIACLAATTRESDDVTAVTKVFTAEQWRGRGCAARLMHRVCQEVLEKKKRVVLYVGNSDELAPARNVYQKVGFQGLNGPQGQQVKDVERWLEIGFKNTTLGHW